MLGYVWHNLKVRGMRELMVQVRLTEMTDTRSKLSMKRSEVWSQGTGHLSVGLVAERRGKSFMNEFQILRFKVSLSLDDCLNWGCVNWESKANEINEVQEPWQQGAGWILQLNSE